MNTFRLSSADALRLLDEQLKEWPVACRNYEALARVRVKEFEIDGSRVVVQFNPERIRSSAARVDARSLRERACFLCPGQLPAEQRQLPFGQDYWLMVNPYPIFPRHFTIPVRAHVPQRISGRYADLLQMARCLDLFVLFYNGPRCGASAPDHAHFQAGSKGFLPIEEEWRHFAVALPEVEPGACVYTLKDYNRAAYVIEATSAEASEAAFRRLYEAQRVEEGDEEPMLNLLVWFEEGKWITCFFSRSHHRPACYYAEGEANLLISPASVDMGGVLVVPQEKDFDKITAVAIKRILREVSL